MCVGYLDSEITKGAIEGFLVFLVAETRYSVEHHGNGQRLGKQQYAVRIGNTHSRPHTIYIIYIS